jgi:hypothetical protein
VDTDRRPLQIAPFQPRLDWQMWFAAMSTPDQYLWTVNLVYKLLRGQPDIVGLFADNPFPGRPPRYIRAVLYKYAFARPGSGHWWRRQRLGNWMPVLSLAYFGAIPTER